MHFLFDVTFNKISLSLASRKNGLHINPHVTLGTVLAPDDGESEALLARPLFKPTTPENNDWMI